MNAKDFLRLGVPLGEATRRATDFVAKFILGGGDKTRLHEEVAAIVANPAAFSALNLRLVRDDGAVVYLNGVEVVRSNMPTGTISSTTRATTSIGGADESAWNASAIDPARLVAGTNVIAVEVHQQSPSSTDVSFNLELVGTEASAPTR